MTKHQIQEYALSALVAFIAFIMPLLISVGIILGCDIIDFILMMRVSKKKKFDIQKEKHLDRFIGHIAFIIFAFILQTYFLKNQPIMIIAQGAVVITQGGRIRRSIKILTGDDLIGELPNIDNQHEKK